MRTALGAVAVAWAGFAQAQAVDPGVLVYGTSDCYSENIRFAREHGLSYRPVTRVDEKDEPDIIECASGPCSGFLFLKARSAPFANQIISQIIRLKKHSTQPDDRRLVGCLAVRFQVAPRDAR